MVELMQSPGPVAGMFGIVLLILGILLVFAVIILITRALDKGRRKRPSSARPVESLPAPEVSPQREQAGTFAKRCPTCKSTYTDETLAFCLSDGSTLERVAVAATAQDPNATLAYTKSDRGEIPPTIQYHPEMPPQKKD